VAISEGVGPYWTEGWECCCPAGADRPDSGPAASLTDQYVVWALVVNHLVRKVEVVVMVVVVGWRGKKNSNHCVHN